MRREIEARDRAERKIHVFFVFLLLSVLSKYTVGQNPACTPNVPYFFVNLSSSPNAVWTSSSVVRQGQCCGAALSSDCISFDVVLNPNVAGIQIDMIGADPAGSLYYQIGCAGSYPGGTVKCISGVGPHQITFCKPGGNANVYQITSIAKPTFPPDDTIRLGCKQKLQTYGVAGGSISWNSIYPGVPGQYNSYLDSTNSTCPTYSPSAGAPPYVDYQVCGLPIATMCGYTNTVCDTVRIYNFPSLTATLTPSPASFCFTGPGSGVTINAGSVLGGQSPYTFIWSNASGTLSTGSSYFASSIGNYSVEIKDMLYNAATCPAIIATVAVTQGTIPVVNAGADISACEANPIINLNGNVQFAGGGAWSGGGGTFSPNNTSLNASYMPTASELAAGFVTLSLSSTSPGSSCPNTSDNVTISFYNLNATAAVTSNYNGADVSCKGDADGTAMANVSGGLAAYSYTWNTVPVQNTANATNLGAGTYVVTIEDANGCPASATVTLVEPNALSATAAISQTISCFGGTNGSASVSQNGGTPGYTYFWNTIPYQTGSTATGMPAGTYSVLVTDLNGCNAIASVNLINPTQVTALTNIISNYNGQNISCVGSNDGSAAVTASGGAGGYTYLWSTVPAQTSSFALGLTAGSYNVQITDANGCATSASVTLNDPPILMATTATQSVICANGNTGSALVNASGGTGAFTYQWSTNPVQTSATASGLIAGNYNVTITDANGCSLLAALSVVEPLPVQVNINSLSYFNGYNISCTGANDGSIDISVFGGVGGYSYSWSNGANTEDINSVMAGPYTIIATDANGCTATMNLNLLEPTKLNATIDSLSLYNAFNVSCNGYTDGAIYVNVSGGNGGYTFNWSNGVITKDNIGIGAGTYALNVVDQNGCITAVNATLIEPVPVISAFNATNPTCNGSNDGSITLITGGGISPYTYNWSNGGAGSGISDLGAGLYVVSVTDGNGCASKMEIKISEPEVLALNRDVSAVKCYNDTTGEISCSVSGGTTPYTFNWSTGATSQNLISLKAGTYSVSVTDANGCEVTDVIAVRQPDSLEMKLNSPLQFNGHNVSMHNGSDGYIGVNVIGGVDPYSFSWNHNSVMPNQINMPAGDYAVECTDANGCKVVGNITLTQPMDLEMPTGFSPNNDGKNDNFIVHGIEAYPSNYLTVFNRWGNIVYQTAMYNNNWNGTNADGQSLPDATYFVLLEVNGKEKVLKGYVEIRR